MASPPSKKLRMTLRSTVNRQEVPAVQDNLPDDHGDALEPPIFRLNEYCWDHILAYLSVDGVILLGIADLRFSVHVLREFCLWESLILQPCLYKYLLASPQVDRILESWGTHVTSLTLKGYTKATEDDWQKILPYFKNLSQLRLEGARLSVPAKTGKCMPIGMTSLILEDCSIPPSILRPWFRKLNPTLKKLEFNDFGERDTEDYYEQSPQPQRARRGQWLKQFEELKQIQSLTTNQSYVLKYLPGDVLETVFVRSKDRLYYMDPEEWKLIVHLPELKKLGMGYMSMPDPDRPTMRDIKIHKPTSLEDHMNLFEMLINFVPPPIENKLTTLILDRTMWLDIAQVLRLTNLTVLKISGHCESWELKMLKGLKKLEILLCEYAGATATQAEILGLIKELPRLKALTLAGYERKLRPIDERFMIDLDQYLATESRKLVLSTKAQGIVSTENVKYRIYRETRDLFPWGGRSDDYTF